MLCRMVLIATGLLAASLAGRPALACTSDKYLCEPNEAGSPKPLLFEEHVDRIFNRKPPAAPVFEPAVKQVDQRPAPPARKREVVKPDASTPREAAMSSRDRAADVPSDIVPVVVKTTSEIVHGATSVSVISPQEWNEIDRLIAERNSAPQASTEGSGSAEPSAAIIETPQPQPRAKSTVLELILMTFSGALAAVTALRVFAA